MNEWLSNRKTQEVQVILAVVLKLESWSTQGGQLFVLLVYVTCSETRGIYAKKKATFYLLQSVASHIR